ncbi:MAG TPA: hypothetical protein VGM03_18405 [Phycisphaerae bacterium]|jgi:hypothetical protein
MHQPNRSSLHPIGRALPLLLLAGGCGILPGTVIPGRRRPVAPSDQTRQARIAGEVTRIDPVTSLPRELSGTVSGSFSGDYQEEILDVYFDQTGTPIAGLSRSQFTFVGTQAGTLTTLNLISVTEMIVVMDEAGEPILDAQGNPMVTGLRSAATGEIIHGDGAFSGAKGTLHSDSVIMFASGASGLGTLDTQLDVQLSGG